MPCLLKSLRNCRWGGWLVGGDQEVRRGWRKEGGKMGLCPATPPHTPRRPGSHQAGCAFLALLTALHMAVAGGWWLRLGDLRLLPPPWEGGESKAELVIIDSSVPGQPKPVPSIPGMAQGHGLEEPSRGSLGDVSWGGTVSCRMCCSPALHKRQAQLVFLDLVLGEEGEGLASPPH